MKQAFELTTRAEVERAYLVGVSLPNSSMERAGNHLDELAQLATTAGADVVGRTVQGRTRIDGTTYIGAGKARDLKLACENAHANLLIFDNDLSPAQARNLEKILGINVIDRTELILDIFARHAKTQQSRIQVELAQLQYVLPRLTRLWDHLSRQAGGIGLRGPGETQLEVDRRRIHQRMGTLRRQLKKVERRRDTLRRGREGFRVCALVGYTNAGKSTMMKQLTGADVVVRDQLFATIETTTRRMRGNGSSDGGGGLSTTNGQHNGVLLIDTVGFIRKLPDHLVTSFKATLEDTAQADLYLHVVDVSHPGFIEQMDVTDTTIATIEDANASTLYIFNKIDALAPDEIEGLRLRYPDGIFVSARSGAGIEALRHRIDTFFSENDLKVEVRLPAGNGKAIARARDILHDVRDTYEGDVCILLGSIDTAHTSMLENIAGAEVRLLF